MRLRGRVGTIATYSPSPLPAARPWTPSVGNEAAPNWTYVFDIAEDPPEDGSTTPINIHLVVVTDAPTLSKLALDVAPAKAIGTG